MLNPPPSVWNHPDTIFTVVVNPHSGPGHGSLPDANYQREIPRLTALNNIRILGYVATKYTQKSFDCILAEIEAYANWRKVAKTQAFRLNGIFFDETPNIYTAAQYKYMRAISAAVRENNKFSRNFVGW